MIGSSMGFMVNAGKRHRADILVFRQSRGYEVRYPFFTARFTGAALL